MIAKYAVSFRTFFPVSDFNGIQDDGNYTITISDDFGSVISAPAEVKEQ